MFKLPNSPSPHAGTHELADFVELQCWINGTASEREIVAYLGQIDDNDTNSGCNDDEDKNADVLDEVMNEVDRRATACSSGYPFTLEMEGTVLKCTPLEPEAAQTDVYLYLLLSTRLNMKNDRIHANIDGANLLETLSAHVLKKYLGASTAQSLVFGTSKKGTFKDKVDHLCQSLREGSGYRPLNKAAVQKNDDKLDTVAWVPFADRLPGQLIVFAQCKTGTNWRDSTAQLQPEDFIKKWMCEPFLVNPLRAYCVSEAVDRGRWEEYNVSAGILFDRCRLVEFSEGIPDATISEIRKWTLAAKTMVGLFRK